MEPLSDEEPFDIVLCLGVLHHTADMDRVLSNLGRMLKDNSELYLWVYGRHGRYRHFLNQRLLGMLIGESHEPEAVRLAAEFAFMAGNGAVLTDLLSGWGDESKYRQVLRKPSWIADQFLHPNEGLLDLEELLAMIFRAGLRLEKWLGIPEEISQLMGCVELSERFALLDERRKLLATDLFLKPDHYFLLLRK
jgi:SAM-dependent methyltransferase